MTIAEIAASLGLGPTEVAAASDDQELRADGVRILTEICRDGVFGVPFFVHRFSRFWGMDRLADFAEHLRAKLTPALSLPEPVSSVGHGNSSEESHAGGCG